MAYVDYICVWVDLDATTHATRCTIDIATGKPIDLPEYAQVITIIEHDRGYEPTLWKEDTTDEMGLENAFP